MGPSASLGASLWPALATTTAESHPPATISAAARRKRSSGFVGWRAASAWSVGISAGEARPGPGPPAQAKTQPLRAKSRAQRPAKFGDSHLRRRLKMPEAQTPARAGVAWCDLPPRDRNGYDEHHERQRDQPQRD